MQPDHVREGRVLSGHRSCHMIPVMPRRANFSALGAGRSLQSGKFCAHSEVRSAELALHRCQQETVGAIRNAIRGRSLGPVLQVIYCHRQCPYAAPAMYRARRPHSRHCKVTCERGGGGKSSGVRSICPEQDGQLNGEPFRSFAIRWSACTGLYVAGRGLRIGPPE